jgi:hypothetical protein
LMQFQCHLLKMKYLHSNYSAFNVFVAFFPMQSSKSLPLVANEWGSCCFLPRCNRVKAELNFFNRPIKKETLKSFLKSFQ